MLKWNWFLWAILIVSCGPAFDPVPDTEMVTLDHWTRPAFALNGMHRFPGVRGQKSLFFLGNSGDQEASVTFRDATPDHVSVPPKRWIPVQLELAARTFTVESPDGDLCMTPPINGAPRTAPQPNVLMVCIDTLRADFFGPETMPELWSLFRAGAIFPRTYSPVPWTLPAHASLFTSTYPHTHGVRLPENRLDPAMVTLAEVLHLNGYATLGITEGNYVSALYQLNQGFDAYFENAPDISSNDAHQASKMEENLAELERQLAWWRDVPVFAFFHTYEVHCPYLPRGSLTDEEGLGQTARLLDMDGKSLDPERLTKIRRLYAGEVRYCDRTLAPLLRRLLARGDWLVVLLSDHGEEFGEHGGLLHADTVFEEAVHVPLAMAGTGVQTLQNEPAKPCSLLDVAPTVVDLLDMQAPSQWQGHSLMRRPATQDLYFESRFFGPHIPAENPELNAVLSQDLKYVERRNFGRRDAWLFDLHNDPAETRDACAARVKECDRLHQAVDTYRATEQTEAPVLEEIPEEQNENLRGLGYLQ